MTKFETTQTQICFDSKDRLRPFRWRKIPKQVLDYARTVTLSQQSHLYSIAIGRQTNRILLSLLLLASLLGTVAPAQAQDYNQDRCFGTKNPNTIVPLPDFTNPDCQDYRAVLHLLAGAANAAIQFVLAIAFIFLLITGYQFITSAGDKAGMENAKRSLLYIVIGILAVLGAFMLVRYISNQFLAPRYQITTGDYLDPPSS